MPPRPIDPARLSGEALMSWYRRSPDEIEQERRTTDGQRYDNFFAQQSAAPTVFRNDTTTLDEGSAGLFTQGAYRPGDDVEFVQVGGKNTSHRQRHERETGKPYPKTESGRNYDVAHIVAKGDGGPDVYENTRPMHPDAHREEHMKNGDFKRWGARSGQGRGGAPRGGGGGGVARGLGVLSLLPLFTGMLSGRIRTDNFDNYISDMLGVPSREDRENYLREHQKEWNPGWKPGDPLIEPRPIA